MQYLPFFDSKECANLCVICDYYKSVRPSELMGIEDVYTAYCFDEAITYIRSRLAKGDKIVNKSNKKCKSFSELYSKYEK